MASSRLTPLLLDQIVSTLTQHPDRCVVLAPGHTPNPRVRYGGRNILLHRYLYEILGLVPVGPRYLLAGGCDTHGCFNPRHRIVSETPGPRTKCPNGHRYRAGEDAPGKYRCAICHEARNARRRKPRVPRKRCRQGHRLTKANRYEWTDKDGIRHHRCRQCQIDTQRRFRARQKGNA